MCTTRCSVWGAVAGVVVELVACSALPVAAGESPTRREKTSSMRLPKASTPPSEAAEVAEPQGASEKVALLHRAASTVPALSACSGATSAISKAR